MVTLEARGLSRAFGGVKAVEQVDFEAYAGEVHALLGENGAGKSTFIKMMAGVVTPDAGEIRYDGEVLQASEARARRGGALIGIVFQELSLVPDLTVAENVWIGHEPTTTLRTVSRRTLRAKTRELFEQLSIVGLDPDREVRFLSVADRHMVETAKMLSTDPKIVIFDEATSALAPSETDWMLARMRSLADAGRVVLMISHRMAEVRAVADRVTVFRNGRNVGVRTREEYDEQEILSLMLARKIEQLYPEKQSHATERIALRVRGLESGRSLQGVDLDLREGEVLGIGGLQGQGQGPLFSALYGMIRAKGQVSTRSGPITVKRAGDTLHAEYAMALVPENRKEGLILTKSLRENLSLPILDKLTRFGVVNRGRERTLVADAIERLQIATQSQDQQVRWLSGGNQQKVALARVLLTGAKILLLQDPTRGVDVGTKAQIFVLIRQLVAEGHSVLFYSTDATELVNVADRVAVMREGRVSAVLEGDQLTEDEILRWAVSDSEST